MDTIQNKLKRAEMIIQETKNLRQLQRLYFQTRDNTNLQVAKIQEKKVDEMIVDYYSGTTQSLLES